MYQHNQQLPVPANQLIDGNWISDPYRTNLPVPQKQIFMQRPDLQWVLGLTAATLVNNLQDNCRNSPISIFAYNLFSANGYANNYFMTIVDEASDFALQQLNVMQQGMDPTATAMRAVQFYAEYAAAACAKNFPLLQHYMTPQMAMAVDQKIQQWNSISAGLQQQQQRYGA